MTDRPDRWSPRSTLLFSGAISLALWVLIALGAPVAHAQGAVQQAGPVVPFDLPVWTQNGVQSDAGNPASPGIGLLGMFNGGNCPFGLSSQSGPGPNSAPNAQLTICQTPTVTTFNFQGLAGQPAPSVQFRIGNQTYPFPGSFAPVIETITATSYTVLPTDNGKLLNFTASSAITLTVPTGLPQPFIVYVFQGGTGQVLTTGAIGASIVNTDGLYHTQQQYVRLALWELSQNNFILEGRTS